MSQASSSGFNSARSTELRKGIGSVLLDPGEPGVNPFNAESSGHQVICPDILDVRYNERETENMVKVCDNCGLGAELTKSKFCRDMLCSYCHGIEDRLERSFIALHKMSGQLLQWYAKYVLVPTFIISIMVFVIMTFS